jgi:hypothetical protein
MRAVGRITSSGNSSPKGALRSREGKRARGRRQQQPSPARLPFFKTVAKSVPLPSYTQTQVLKATMDRASAYLSISGRDAPVRRRRRGALFRLRRHRSPSPTTSGDASSQELSPLSSAASAFQQPSHLLYPANAVGSIFITVSLPVFRGDPGECPDAHLRRFDRVCLANGDATSATAARIFPASLDADAALWYDLKTAGVAEDSSPPPWDAVRAAFLGFFRVPGAEGRARDELKALRQRPDETVSRYHLRMLGILRRFPDGGVDVADALLKDAFVDGLRAEFREWVAPQRPETLDEAASLALSWERAEGVREARRVAMEMEASAEKCTFCGVEGHEESRCEVWRRMGEPWRSSSINSESATAMAAKDGEETEEGGRSKSLARLESAASTRSTQCRCRKHQCWKKAVAASEVAGGSGGSAAAGRVTETISYNLMDF